jgi:hypothetical protein
MILRLHGDTWLDVVKEEVKSNWINYIFATENDAIAFQSAIFGRLLLASYQTSKTTVIHDGFMGTFALEEQFANIEMLRLWEDDGVATPGAQGGVMALMHISSNFGEGWARWVSDGQKGNSNHVVATWSLTLTELIFLSIPCFVSNCG